jgi:hypothetical protein
MGGARAFLVPGQEDFGIPPVEAQAAGIPVVAWNQGGVRESVVDGQTGVLYDDPSPRGLLEGIERLERSDDEPAPRPAGIPLVPVSDFVGQYFSPELGATYRGRAAGSCGALGVLSFNGNKIITTSGGGMLVTDDRDLADRVRHLATQARQPVMHYEHEEVGFDFSGATESVPVVSAEPRAAAVPRGNGRFEVEVSGAEQLLYISGQIPVTREGSVPEGFEALLALYRSAGRDAVKFQSAVEQWFDDAMERVSGWYKRRTQGMLFVIGLAIAGQPLVYSS